MDSIRDKVEAARGRATLKKEAGIFSSILNPGSVKAGLKTGLGIGIASAALAGGAAVANSLTDVVGGAMQKKIGIRRMYRDNPWLENEDKSTVSKFYSTLHRFAPSMAMDPHVAGSYMKKQLEFQDIGVQPNDLQTLTNIEKAKSDVRANSIMSQAFGSGLATNVGKALIEPKYGLVSGGMYDNA